nr:calcium-translocating P-type ATPase, SERCA-type [Bacillota bacterium]
MTTERTSNTASHPTAGAADQLRWAQPDAAAVLAALGSDAQTGLSSSEAAARLARYGPNKLPSAPRRSFVQMLWEQLTEPLVLVLLGAAVLSAVLREWVDVFVILAIALLNAVLGATQEQRAEASLEALKRISAPTARVVRDGHVRQIPAEELVPGDIILLEAGDSVPADARLLETAALKVDESTLTGESEPVEKRAAPIDAAQVHGLGDLANLVFSGTTVTYGRGVGVVYATGINTALGKIAGILAEEPAEETPLQRRMAEVGRTLGLVAGGLVVLVFVIGLVQGQSFIDMLLTSVSLAVAAIPEGLPAIVTIVLALGVQRMAQRRAIVRRLPAVETLGAATVIASDKTGTLTLNRMTVTHLVTLASEVRLDVEGDTAAPSAGEAADAGDSGSARPSAPPLAPDVAWLVAGGALANDARLEEDAGELKLVGDPTETALLVAARRMGVDLSALEKAAPRVAELPFDSDRKRMTTFHRMTEEAERFVPGARALGPVLAFTKGAPDVVLERCRSVLDGNGVRPLTDADRQRILADNARLAELALRVLAVACRPWSSVPERPDAEEAEQDLIFIGIVGMFDPPRPEVAQSIQEAKQAGIRTLMVTGDHAATAAAIAKRLGLIGEGEEARVISGRELDAMDDQALQEAVKVVSVFARVSPEHKLRIVRALKANGAVVAVTGDGVNDAPALKGADIGCAMGISGTDVSRAAADMVLADDNYATIVAAVREGRVIYANIRKAIHYLLSCNIGEIVAIFLGIALGLGSPLTPIQLLWVNLVTDGLPALALGVEPAEPSVMRRRPRHPKESVFSGGLGVHIAWQGILLGLLTLGAYWWGLNHGTPAQARTLAFATLVFTQLAHSFNVRSTDASLFTIGWFTNRPLLLAVAVSAVLQLAVMTVPFLEPVFDVTPLDAQHWRVLLPAVAAPWVGVELVKALRRRSSAA